MSSVRSLDAAGPVDNPSGFRYDGRRDWDFFQQKGVNTALLGQKLVALLIMVVPAAIAMYGIKLIRDAIFYSFAPDTPFLWGKLIAGIVLFAIPISFIAGFILHHDRKRNRVQPRFMIREPDEDE